MNWSEFFTMGGYAFYVWPVYALAALVLLYNLIQPLARRRQVMRRLRDYYRLKGKTR